jgi:hypothetical protein
VDWNWTIVVAAETETPPAPSQQEAPDAPEKAQDAAPKAAKKKQAKQPKAGKDKAPTDGDSPSIAAHPRAAGQVARAKSWGGFAGFVVAAYLSAPTHSFAETGLRALESGIVCYVVVWAAAVFVWRRLVVMEIKSREQQLHDAVYGPREPQTPRPPGRKPS